MRKQSSQSTATATKQNLDSRFSELSSGPEGLSEAEAAKRLEKYGVGMTLHEPRQKV